jgi:hypothetical protein
MGVQIVQHHVQLFARKFGHQIIREINENMAYWVP